MSNVIFMELNDKYYPSDDDKISIVSGNHDVISGTVYYEHKIVRLYGEISVHVIGEMVSGSFIVDDAFRGAKWGCLNEVYAAVFGGND